MPTVSKYDGPTTLNPQEGREVRAFHWRSISDGDVPHSGHASDLLGHFPKMVRQCRAVREFCPRNWKIHRKNTGCIHARVEACKLVEASDQQAGAREQYK